MKTTVFSRFFSYLKFISRENIITENLDVFTTFYLEFFSGNKKFFSRSFQANDLFRQLSQGNEEMLNRVTAQLHAAHQDQVRPDPAQPTRQPQDDQGRENETNSESFSFSGYFSRLMRSNPEMVGVFSTFEKYIPFVLILVTKQLFDHSTGKNR